MNKEQAKTEAEKLWKEFNTQTFVAILPQDVFVNAFEIEFKRVLTDYLQALPQPEFTDWRKAWEKQYGAPPAIDGEMYAQRYFIDGFNCGSTPDPSVGLQGETTSEAEDRSTRSDNPAPSDVPSLRRAAAFGGAEMKPFLFLDIDGVLNDHLRHSNKVCGLKPSCVREMNRVLKTFPDLQLVISSAWRYHLHSGYMTMDGFSMMLQTHGLDCHGRIHGITEPDGQLPIDMTGRTFMELTDAEKYTLDNWGQIRRVGQINAYIAAHGIQCFVVVDDIALDIQPLIQTHRDIGLTVKDANGILNIIRRKLADFAGLEGKDPSPADQEASKSREDAEVGTINHERNDLLREIFERYADRTGMLLSEDDCEALSPIISDVIDAEVGTQTKSDSEKVKTLTEALEAIRDERCYAWFGRHNIPYSPTSDFEQKAWLIASHALASTKEGK